MEIAQALAGKRVLFIAPMFFGYEKLIKEELESKGAIVDYYNDRPDNNFWTKALIRVDRRLLARKTDNYYKSIILNNRNKTYDHILIVRGEAISTQMLKKLRQSQPNARMCLYLWDSMHYNPNARKILDSFDQVYSFDRIDVSNNTNMKFLPLFYAREFERAAQWQGQAVYDACFIGTIHTDRYKVLEKIIEKMEKQGQKVFVFCYYPSKTLFKLRALIDPGFRNFGKKHINFTSMKLSEVVDKISESKAVIDVNRPGQLGLTMRTIEAIGAQKKIITTNKEILEYEIFNPQNAIVVDRVKPVINESFINSTNQPFNEESRQNHSITAWVLKAFDL